jgi:hypothetical protein
MERHYFRLCFLSIKPGTGALMNNPLDALHSQP